MVQASFRSCVIAITLFLLLSSFHCVSKAQEEDHHAPRKPRTTRPIRRREIRCGDDDTQEKCRPHERQRMVSPTDHHHESDSPHHAPPPQEKQRETTPLFLKEEESSWDRVLQRQECPCRVWQVFCILRYGCIGPLLQPNPFPLTPTPTTSPAPTASLQPTAIEIPVPIVQFFLAFVIPELAAIPSDDEFDELLAVTNTFFTKHLETTFEVNSTVQFDRLEMELVETRFEADLPAERFNVYMELDAVAFYTGRSTPPLPLETLMILVEADFREYILDFVRPLGTTFVATNEVVVAQLGFVEDS